MLQEGANRRAAPLPHFIVGYTMCQICALTRTFDPLRHSDGEEATSFAAVSEFTDAAANTGTSYSINVGDTFNGMLSAAGDRDWVAVTLSAGSTYDIALTGVSLSDPYLRLYDSNGTLVTYNDDNGSLDSGLTYTAETTGTYYIAAGAFGDSYSGSYQISFDVGTPPAPAEEGTLDELAEFLTSGYWGRGPRGYDTSDSNVITVNIGSLSAAEQQLARWAFEAWELVANIDFVEVSGSAEMTFDNSDSGAYASSSYSGGYITSSDINVSSGWASNYGTTISSYTFSTYVHEIGHALGLGHQGDYNGRATYGQDETFSNDSYQLSVMSYFSQTDNTTVDADYAEPIGAMMADIVAVQSLYGAAAADSQTAGNTVWGEGTNLTGYMADVLNSIDGSSNANLGTEAVTFTIYDYDGTDLINLAPSRADNRLDMNDMGISDIGGRTGNVMIARDTVIENATMGRGNDTVIGNDVGNVIKGRQGSDDLSGAGGRDKLVGNGGGDTLSGGDDNDRLLGGGGNDALAGDGGRDRLMGGKGSDELTGGLGNDVLVGGGSDDSFIFDLGCDRDKIRDFSLGTDSLVLDTELTNGLTSGADVWDAFGSIRKGNAILNFGDGDVIKLIDVTDSTSLIDDIVFV